MCLIAAGGTAGHVRPALAVAEALRERGAKVTFAGSPDRVESQLVPEAGFELDTFAISGLPRRPGLELLRALVRAVRAPFACARILGRRRPDVVLGGGGYVAGPMVLAARLRGIPDRADGSRRASRAREPPGGALRAARLSRLPDTRAKRREVQRRRQAGSGGPPRREPRGRASPPRTSGGRGPCSRCSEGSRERRR